MKKSTTKLSPEMAARWQAAEDTIAKECTAFVYEIIRGMAPYQVILNPKSTRVGSTTRTRYCEFVSTNPLLEGWSEYYCFQVNRNYNFSSDGGPEKPVMTRHLPFLPFSARARKRTYTRLDATTYAKILKDMQGLMENFILRRETLADEKAVRESWAALKQVHIGNMVVPPSLDVKLWTEPTPPTLETVPSFSIQLRPGHLGGLNRARLSLDQVQRVVQVVNDVLGTENYYVIRGKRPGDDGYFYWDGASWHRHGEQSGFGKVFASVADAKAGLEEARQSRGVRMRLAEVVPWADLFSPPSVVDSED